MKNLIICFTFLSVIFLVISCRKETVRVEQILQKAESIVEQHPDSALLILDEIKDAEKLKKSLYYEYYLVQIQAKDKSYKDITSDTLIFTIQNYYDKKNDYEMAALATFYCGRVRQEQKRYEQAVHTYLAGEKYLLKSSNNNLKGLYQASIGQVYYKQLLKDEAIVYYKIAVDYFHQAGNYRNEIISNNFIGNCLLMQEKNDSAFVYYFKALALADKHGLKREQLSVREGLGVAYRKFGDWKNSETFFREAWLFSSDSLYKARLSSNLARLFELQGKNDSAIYYLQKALTYLPQEQNNSLAANIYDTWSAIEENQGNYRNALGKYRLYNKHLAQIISENKNSAILEIEAKYNFQLIENRNKQLLIERQRILLLSSGLLLIFMVLILISLRLSASKERKLNEAEQKIYQMKEMSRSFNEKEGSFRDVLIRHFDILKKTALLEGYLKAEERKTGKLLLQKFNEVVYGEKNLNWDILYQTLNKLSNGYFEQLRNRLPQLDVSEFRICCLIFVDFNNTEIAIVLNYSVNTVQAKRSSIRRKLGLKTYGNINDFLKNTPQN
jgi:tetratricopeptide (TPR) repeat protein